MREMREVEGEARTSTFNLTVLPLVTGTVGVLRVRHRARRQLEVSLDDDVNKERLVPLSEKVGLFCERHCN